MQRLNFYIMIIILLLCSCKKEDDVIPTITDDYDVVISQPYQWIFYLHEGDPQTDNSYIKFPIVYENKYLLIPTTNNNGERFVTLVNSDNGSKIWHWSDIDELSTTYTDISSYHKSNKTLIYQYGKWSIAINLENGNTKWKIQRENSFHTRINGYENDFYLRGYSNNYPELNIFFGYRGDLETGEIELFLIPDFSFDYTIEVRCCDVTEMIPYKIGETQHLVVVYQELRSSDVPNFQSYMGLYNLKTDEWVYDRKIMNEPNLYGVSLAPPKIYAGKFYANIGKELVCHDIETGEQVWSREFPQDFMFSGFIIEEGKIIAMCEDTILYCLDPETGETVWEGEGAGTSSVLSYLDGVVYFVGGSTRKLHAVDVSTGETVWRIDSRNMGDEYGKFGPNAVYVIPGENGEKGKVIALTSMYAICYEAYK